MEYQGYDISASQEIVPRIQHLLDTFRSAGFPIYHTREGNHDKPDSFDGSLTSQATVLIYLLYPVEKPIGLGTTLRDSGSGPLAR